jgi:hypothetical protein
MVLPARAGGFPAEGLMAADMIAILDISRQRVPQWL